MMVDGVDGMDRVNLQSSPAQDLQGVVKGEVNVKTSESPAVSDNRDKLPEVDNFDDMLETFKKKLQKLKEIFNTEAQFEIDKDTRMVIVKIKDKDTGEVIRQIPPEVVVKIAKTIDEFLGLLLDERV